MPRLEVGNTMSPQIELPAIDGRAHLICQSAKEKESFLLFFVLIRVRFATSEFTVL